MEGEKQGYYACTVERQVNKGEPTADGEVVFYLNQLNISMWPTFLILGNPSYIHQLARGERMASTSLRDGKEPWSHSQPVMPPAPSHPPSPCGFGWVAQPSPGDLSSSTSNSLARWLSPQPRASIDQHPICQHSPVFSHDITPAVKPRPSC